MAAKAAHFHLLQQSNQRQSKQESRHLASQSLGVGLEDKTTEKASLGLSHTQSSLQLTKLPTTETHIKLLVRIRPILFSETAKKCI